jgi:hypothetical protein
MCVEVEHEPLIPFVATLRVVHDLERVRFLVRISKAWSPWREFYKAGIGRFWRTLQFVNAIKRFNKPAIPENRKITMQRQIKG